MKTLLMEKWPAPRFPVHCSFSLYTQGEEDTELICTMGDLKN